MSRELADRLVFLTGASDGIGAAAAEIFVREGARVVGVARSADALDALAERLGRERFLPRVADVADADTMRRVTGSVLAELGVPDVVIANAGIGLDALFEETDDDKLRRVLEVNVGGVVRTVRPFVGRMVERGSGRIVFVSSVVGKRGIPHYAAYSASKFALHGMADALRVELAGTGVSVGVLCPASTSTGFSERALSAGPKQRRVRPRRHSAESVGRILVDFSRSRRREQVIGLEGKLLAWSNVLVPALLDRILARILVNRG